MYNLVELLVWQGKSRVWQRFISARRKQVPRPKVQVIFVGASPELFKGEYYGKSDV